MASHEHGHPQLQVFPQPSPSAPITVTVTAFLNHIYLRPRLIRPDVRQSEQEAAPRSLAQGRQ